MSIKDDTFEMPDNTPEKSKKSILLLVLLILIVSSAIPFYLQKHAASKSIPVAQINEPVQTESQVAAQPSAVKTPTIKAVVSFDEASAVINPDQMTKLQTFFQAIKDSSGTLQIDGYTDNVGLAAEGLALSRQRTEAVDTYLKTLGSPSNIMVNASWHGEQNPAGDNSTEQGRQQNRRVELIFTPAP
jgi:Outer membrane protein and related peptidoglycan-associated (lipo)proteins